MPETSYPNDSEPIVNPDTLEFRRAIADEEQGYSVITRLKQDSWWRNQKQAAIMAKYNDEPPYDQSKLEAAKQGWRRNASTCFMSVIIKRILPSYNQVIDQAQYLTQARFPGSETQDPDVQQKEIDFRHQVTTCIRSWQGWQAFKSQIILENLLFGYTGGGWTDEVTWEPIFLRQDEAYFPDGCSQEARLMPLWCWDQNFQIHEMAAYLVNPQASEAAGWNIDNMVVAINDAKPENRNSGVNADVRKYQDMIRESSLGTSYSTGVKVIKAVHLFVQEVSGKVSHYIYDDRSKKQLFVRLDRFDKMEECLSLMAIEVGNGKLHGSKGAGRILYNLHVSVDQARNLLFDNLMLSGLLVLEQGEGAKPQQALTVVHPVAIIGKGFKAVQHGFTIDTDAFFAIDDKMTSIAEAAIGAFIPGQIQNQQGEKATASEINYTASIEQELKQGNLARFVAQFQLIVTGCQKRICSIDNIKKAVALYKQEQMGMVQRFTQGVVNLFKTLGQKISGEFEIATEDPLNESGVQCCLALLRKNLTPKDIYVLGQSPSYDLTTDTTADNATAFAQLAAEYKGDPNVDQVELTKQRISSLVGGRMMEDLVIPSEDNTLTSEATRLQLMELPILLHGEPVPISPRDFDPVHLAVMQQKASQMMGQNGAGITPEMIPLFQNVFKHYQDHLQSAVQKAGSLTPELKPFADFAKQVEQIIGQAQQQASQMAQSPAANPQVAPAATQATSSGFTHDGLQNPATLSNPALAAEKKPLAHGPIATPTPVVLQ